MCVSYRKINGITKPLYIPITRCSYSISTFGSGSDKVWIISRNERQGCNQISVSHVDKEKLAFFAPDNQKYMFLLMPFGPTNAPGFYSDMIKKFKYEWDILFIETLQKK